MAEATYLEAIRQGLFEEMERDPSVFCMGEDIGAYGGAFKVTEGLLDRFGAERVIDTDQRDRLRRCGRRRRTWECARSARCSSSTSSPAPTASDQLRRHGALPRLPAVPDGRPGTERRLRARRTVPLAES
jgi:hypothetical protein